MKQGLNFGLKVTFEDLNFRNVEKIEFAFSQYIIGPEVVKKAEWNSDGNNNDAEKTGENEIVVFWKAEETYKFLPGKEFYMDVRIWIKDSKDNPSTEIVALTMDRTLFME